MDLRVPIVIADELSDEIVSSTGSLDLASGEISRVEYTDYDLAQQGLPWERDDYEFSCGVLSHQGKDVEFRVDVNKVTGQYAVSATELMEIKVRAAALFAGVSSESLLASAAARSGAAGSAVTPRGGKAKPGPGRSGPLH